MNERKGEAFRVECADVWSTKNDRFDVLSKKMFEEIARIHKNTVIGWPTAAEISNEIHCEKQTPSWNWRQMAQDAKWLKTPDGSVQNLIESIHIAQVKKNGHSAANAATLQCEWTTNPIQITIYNYTLKKSPPNKKCFQKSFDGQIVFVYCKSQNFALIARNLALNTKRFLLQIVKWIA